MPRPILKFSILFQVLCLFCALNTHAQSRDSLLAVYNSQTIHSYGPAFVKGSNQLKFHGLKSEFRSPQIQDLYKKAKTNRVWSRVLTVTSLASLATSTILRFNDKTKGGSLAFGAAGIVLNLGSYQ